MEIEDAKDNCNEIIDRVASYFVGDRSDLEKILCAGLVNGHILFEDNPGLGKTLLTKIFAQAMGCNWSRTQFTP